MEMKIVYVESHSYLFTVWGTFCSPPILRGNGDDSCSCWFVRNTVGEWFPAMTGTSLVVFGCVFGERGHFTHTHGCQRHPQHGLGRAVKEDLLTQALFRLSPNPVCELP